MNKYLGITHYIPIWLLPVWKKIFCKRGIHLFDEVLSIDGDHYLYCDACEFKIKIKDE